MRKYGVRMLLPEGKRAGFYAQIVKALAWAVDVYDRDKELIIVHTKVERNRVAEVLQKYKVDWEPMQLLLLPEDAALDPRAEDYGFTSKFGNTYLYEEQAICYSFAGAQPAEADPASALLQMEEFILASFEADGVKTYCVEPHLRETIEGIARRYGVRLTFILSALQ
jgi:hypothetical protein